MKTYKRLFGKVISFENLLRAAQKAQTGKRIKPNVAQFNFNLESELLKLQEELEMKTYRHGKYRVFTIRDPKEREIAAAPFKDRVVHHAAHDVIEPLIDKSFIYDSYACRNGKGTHKAVDRAQGFLMANRFCLHGDIKKYFHSIDRDILKGILRMRIEDKDLLWLLDEIIDSARQSDEQKDRGLPIGNLTSQFFANLYLNELDYFVKFDLRYRHYLRYMDDFLAFGNDKEDLFEVKMKISNFLKNKLRLDLHEGKSQVYKTKNGVKFLGFRIFKDYRRLASDNVRRFKKRLKKFAYLLEKSGENSNHSPLTTNHSIRDSVRCWAAHSSYANAKTLRLQIWKRLADKEGRLGILLKDILVGCVN